MDQQFPDELDDYQEEDDDETEEESDLVNIQLQTILNQN